MAITYKNIFMSDTIKNTELETNFLLSLSDNSLKLALYLVKLFTTEELDEIFKEKLKSNNPICKENDCEVYTSKEICYKYNISSSTLERWIRKGLKYKSTGKKTKRIFTDKDVEFFLTKRR